MTTCPHCNRPISSDMPQIPPAYGAKVQLSPLEYRLFHILWERRGSEVGAREMYAAFAEKASSASPESMHVAIHRLRQKLPLARIATVRRRGYVLDPVGQESPRSPAHMGGPS